MTVVVKLGGSLATAGTLRAWIDVLSTHGRGRCVVVPGGGVFADAVRVAQPQFGFSDRAAHAMGLLAMEQYARVLVDIAPPVAPPWRLCASIERIRAEVSAGGVAVWQPSAMLEHDPGVSASWHITSDSLAAWLAGRIAARRLVLVKSAPPPPPPVAPGQLAEAGLVDSAFPAYLAAAGCELRYCGPGDEPRLAEALELG